jgi:hypothetical protein
MIYPSHLLGPPAENITIAIAPVFDKQPQMPALLLAASKIALL